MGLSKIGLLLPPNGPHSCLRRSPLTGLKQTSSKRDDKSAFVPNQTSISTRKRDILRSRWVSNRTGESRNDAARKCSEAGHWRDRMRYRRKPSPPGLFRGRDASWPPVSRSNGQKWRRTEAAGDESGEAVLASRRA